MNNRLSKFKRFMMNVERYGELLREIDEAGDLNGGNVIRKIERLEEQRSEHIVKWEEGVFFAHHRNIIEGTLLHAASVAGCTRVAQALLAAGANIEAKCRRGFTPLHVAAKTGLNEMVELLLHNGANIEEVDNNGCTPLHLSAAFCSPGCVRALLLAGAHIDARDKKQNTPLLLAVSCHVEENRMETLRILFDNGADVNATDEERNNALHLCLSKRDNTVVLEGYLTGSEVSAIRQITQN